MTVPQVLEQYYVRPSESPFRYSFRIAPLDGSVAPEHVAVGASH